jgi:hypothetical protein
MCDVQNFMLPSVQVERESSMPGQELQQHRSATRSRRRRSDCQCMWWVFMGMVIHSVSHVVVAVVGSQHERARVVARVLDPKGRVGLLGCLFLI